MKQQVAKRKYTDRKCMTCRKQFRSAGNQNRMCLDCRRHRARADGEYVAMEVEGWR